MVSWLDPHVDRYVLSTAGEEKVVEVKKHWAASAWPAIRLAIGIVIFISAFAYQSPAYWVFIIVGGGLAGQALWRILEEYRDRFVITNQRVFRVHGVLSVARASIPLVRILDITVKKSIIGRWLNYGHFVFESAAQVQDSERDQVRQRYRSAGGRAADGDGGRYPPADRCSRRRRRNVSVRRTAA